MKRTEYTQIKETVYRQRLTNGLEVILVPKKELSQTYGVFTTNYGSIDNHFVPLNETNPIKVPDGIAHFLEHKLFEKENHDVFQEFTALGASANAFTSFTKTAYLFSTTQDVLPATKILLDFVQSPYFSESSVEKEKGIIAQEIQMYDDQADWRAFFGIIEAMYKHHPVRIDIAGTVDAIQNISKDDLYTCYHTFYHPSNMVFTLVGNFDVDAAMALIEENQAAKSFAPVEAIERLTPMEPATVHKRSASLDMPVAMEKCMVGIKETPTDDPGAFIKQELMSEMVLDFFYSKAGDFYQELYDDDLIDGRLGFESERQPTFAFSIIGGSTTDVKKFKTTVLNQLASLKTYRFTDESFNRMKKKMIGGLLEDMDAASDIANAISQYHLLGIDYFSLLPVLESITKSDVETFLHQWIQDDNVSTFAIRKGTRD
ncbi:putative Zn-dependent peptidase [Streptohalobacillus salinus]|uniref:Putative Zn-dependent peptidase n=1 Tax=Streptohalobacillus salinus TaxID=621096 RepID=A0A2V3WD90_9BACI|nr:pitrilysin family protein [Streptohalobacillus salinus]PXW92473.1 putative Zn-dependent peptidase [Streptohalobacillus salinus]